MMSDMNTQIISYIGQGYANCDYEDIGGRVY